MSQAGRSADLSPEQGDSMHPKVDAVDPRVGALHPKMAAVDPRVGALHPKMAAVDPRVGALHPKMAAVDPRVEPVHPKVDAVPWEARAFQGQRAGVVTRTAANVVDSLLVVGV